MEERTITLTTETGEEIICDILFTYFSEEFNKNYVVFQARNTNEASAASYIETGDGAGELQRIETDEEWEMLEDLLEDYANSLENTGSCGGACGSCGGSCSECDCDGNCDCE